MKTVEVRQRWQEKASFAVILVFAAAAWGATGTPDAEKDIDRPADFTVTTKVIRKADDIEPIGVNRTGDPGGTNYSRNTFIHQSGNEPINLRLMARFCYKFPDGGIRIDSGTTWWNGTLRSGFFSGADVRVYRLVDEQGNKLALKPAMKKRGYMTIDPSAADHVVFVGKTRVAPMGDKKHPLGGWVAVSKPSARKPGHVEADLERCRVYLVDDMDLHPGDYIFFEKRVLGIDPGTIKAGDKIRWPWKCRNCEPSLEYHSTPLPKEMLFPGESCLRIDGREGACELSQPYLFSARGGYYGPLESGKRYRVEVWLRQSGIQGPVEFSFSKFYQEVKREFEVTGRWRRFTCDFVGRELEGKRLYGPKFTFTGPGTLWMDNCRIFRYDSERERDAVFTPGKLTLEKLIDSQPPTGRKGALRFWDGLGQMSMKSLLSMHGDSRAAVNAAACYIRGTRSLPYALMYTEATGDSPETRMVPWLIIQVTFTEPEYRGLIEYLGDPYDPKVDTPESKPWAHMRYTQRGHGRPWTDTFREIIIEFGNENWHNRFPLFPFWIGFGEYSAIHQGGKEYGIWTRYYIEQIIKHPCWKARNLGRKIKFCLGGNYFGKIDAKTGKVTGYGQEATQANGYNSYEGHAVYVGPLWELGQEVRRPLNDDGFQSTLLAYEAGHRKRQENISATYFKLRELGFTKHRLGSYEGGPSGFSITGRGLTKEDRRAIQTYGHSLAIGVASLDCWLDTYRLGWSYHCYYFYGQGRGWNSHSTMDHGFLASPAFLAMKMRNHVIRGDMLAVDVRSVPTLLYGQATSFAKARAGKKRRRRKPAKRKVPLVKCYAFRDSNRYAVAVLSLKLDGRHNGQDFGDGYTPVKLRLPFKRAAKVTLYKLVGDPRDTNMTERKVRLERRSLRASAVQGGVLKIDGRTGGGKKGMPPGTAFVYVFEGVK